MAVGFIWAHGAAFITMVYPLWEIHAELYEFVTGKKLYPPAEPAAPPPAPKVTTPLSLSPGFRLLFFLVFFSPASSSARWSRPPH